MTKQSCAEGISSMSVAPSESAELIAAPMVELANKCYLEDDMDLNGWLCIPRSGYSSPSTRASTGTMSDVDDEAHPSEAFALPESGLFAKLATCLGNEGNSAADQIATAKMPPTRKAPSGAQFRLRCYRTIHDQECHACDFVESLEDDTGVARARDKLQRRMRSRRLGYVGAVAPRDLAAHLGRKTHAPLPVSFPSLSETYFLEQEDEGVQNFLRQGARRKPRIAE